MGAFSHLKFVAQKKKKKKKKKLSWHFDPTPLLGLFCSYEITFIVIDGPLVKIN